MNGVREGGVTQTTAADGKRNPRQYLPGGSNQGRFGGNYAKERDFKVKTASRKKREGE